MKTRSYSCSVTFPKYVSALAAIVSLVVGGAIHIALGVYSVGGFPFGLAACVALLSILMGLRWATAAIISAILLQPEIQKDQAESREKFRIEFH